MIDLTEDIPNDSGLNAAVFESKPDFILERVEET